jgi:hypothetical protein
VTVLEFARSASWAVGLGAFGCLAAAVLAKAYERLTHPLPPIDHDDEDDLPPASGEWFMTVVSTLSVCFALAWVGTALVIAWKTRGLSSGDGLLFTGDDGLARLYAYQGAAAAATLGSLAVMGSLLMARAHDRLVRFR